MTANETPLRRGGRKGLRIFLFLLFCALLITLFGVLFAPIWLNWNNYDTVYGYYEQPEDAFEVAFIGPSNVISGISPMELYDEYGISSYNFATEGQPMYCSLYWLKEAYRTQSGTLRTVVLDVSSLRERDHKESAYHKAFDGMRLSCVKLDAVTRHTDSVNDAITFLVPLFSYHDRWSDLDEEDLLKLTYTPNTVTMGYYFIEESYLDSEISWDEMWLPDGELDEEDWDDDALSEEYLGYLDEIVTFCEEHDLNLILIKTPHGYWNDAYHNAVQAVADAYGLEFLDMNFSPVFDELGFNYATDTKDGAHPNYYGMQKITSYLGEYLSSAALASDVRGEADYAWLEESLAGYTEYITDTVAIKETTSLTSYIAQAAEGENNVLFIVSQDESAAGLDEETREALSLLGISKLAALEEGESYLGIIAGGQVILEETGDGDLAETYRTSDGVTVTLSAGSTADVIIGGTDEAKSTGGLNLVVYNTTFGDVSDASVFPTRTSDGLTRDGMNLSAALQSQLQSGTRFEDLSDQLQGLYQYLQRY